jgi:uncharacterized protein
VLHYFRFSALLTLAAIVLAGFAQGLGAALTVMVLIAIEIAFSFDNAVINATVLERLSKLWQHLFLTIGMVVAVLGVRFLLPILIVMLTAHLSWGDVLHEALHQPAVYGQHLDQAHIAIAAFGGGFLLTLALYFLFDDNRDVLWLERLERPLQKLGGAPVLVAVIVLLLSVFAGSHRGEVLRTGLIGVAAYTALKLFVDGLGRLAPNRQKHYVGWPAFLAFLYLQVLDASFSFDGVLGAFAITNKVLLIALGLGVGAFWVRSLTVLLVRRGTLRIYIYLEHGAHYAILVLAVALLTSIFYNVPDVVTGVTGLGVLGASFVASHQALAARRQSEAQPKKT